MYDNIFVNRWESGESDDSDQEEDEGSDNSEENSGYSTEEDFFDRNAESDHYCYSDNDWDNDIYQPVGRRGEALRF